MRTVIALVAALLAAAPAPAAGLGTTAAVGGRTVINLGELGGALPAGTPGGFLPSFDVRPGDLRLQFHVLEFLQGLADESVYFGANGYWAVHRAPVGAAAWEAVIAPGAGLDLYVDPVVLVLTAESQFGLETSSAEAGFGLYVVPAFGVAIADDQTDLVTAGTVQLSVWFGS